MKQIGGAAKEAEGRARHAQWHWCRRPNGFCDRPLWRLIAGELGMPPYQVIAFVNRLEEFGNDAGNRGYTRGEITHFNPAEFGLALGMPEEDAARIFAQLERSGWIAYDHIADFYDRNKDREDAGAALRQRRKYARDKARKMLAKLDAQGKLAIGQRTALERSLDDIDDAALFTMVADLQRWLSTGQTPHAFLTREGLVSTVRLTPEKSTDFQGEAVDNSGDGARGEKSRPSDDGDRGAASDPQAAAQMWIDAEGRKLVVERMDVPLTRADLYIERWLHQQLQGDAAALALILQTEEHRGYIGARFHTDVTDAIARHLRQAAAAGETQQRLPLSGIQPVKRTG